MAGLLDYLNDIAKLSYKTTPLGILNTASDVGGQVSEKASEYLGEKAMQKTGSPLAATGAYMLPFLAGMIAPGGKTKLAKTEFELAHDLAQQRAALPVSEGGLGLPTTNTAMDRANAMGFDTRAYHATNNDIKNFIPSDVGTYGAGVYSAKRPEIAEGYYQDFNNSNTIPLLINRGKEKQFQSFSDYVGQKGKNRNTFDYGNDLRNEGYNSLSVKFFPEGEVREYNNFNPSDVRSVNAAFDPFRRNESDILAGVAAAPVGLLAVDKEKTKKKRSNK
jgi:hypothetical protein